MKSKIFLLTVLIVVMAWVTVHSTPPTQNAVGKAMFQPLTGMPAVNDNGQHKSIPPQNNNQGKPLIPSPNDDRINQMTPDITNYFNYRAVGNNAKNYPSNWNGGYCRTNGMHPGGSTNYWPNGRTNWSNIHTNRHHRCTVP